MSSTATPTKCVHRATRAQRAASQKEIERGFRTVDAAACAGRMWLVGSEDDLGKAFLAEAHRRGFRVRVVRAAFPFGGGRQVRVAWGNRDAHSTLPNKHPLDTHPVLPNTMLAIPRPTAAVYTTQATLRVVSLNVTARLPLPYPFSRTRASPLHSSSRLYQQLACIARLEPDVVCIQELMCPRALEKVKETLHPAVFTCVHRVAAEVPARGTVVAWAAVVITSALAMIGMSFVRPVTADAFTFSAFVGGLWVVMFAFAYVICTSSLMVWLSGLESGLVTFVRKTPRLQIRHVDSTLFAEQQGDSLNLLNKRGFLAVEVRLDEAPLLIVNAHLNRGRDNCPFRLRQVKELVDVIQPASTAVLVGTMNCLQISHEIRALQRECELSVVTQTDADFVLFGDHTRSVVIGDSHVVQDAVPLSEHHCVSVAEVHVKVCELVYMCDFVPVGAGFAA